jgi:hypothetical protein
MERGVFHQTQTPPEDHISAIEVIAEGARAVGGATLGVLASAIDGFIKTPIEILAWAVPESGVKEFLEGSAEGWGEISGLLADLSPNPKAFKVGKIGGDIAGLAIGAKGLATAVTKAGQIVKVGKVAEGLRYAISGGSAALARDVVFVVDGAAAAEAASVGAGSLLMAAGSGKTGLDDLEGLGEGGDGERIANVQKQESPIWRSLEPVKGRDIKTSGTGKDKKFFKWDHTHNDIEVFNHRGQHLGTMHPITGEMYKPPVSGRTEVI